MAGMMVDLATRMQKVRQESITKTCVQMLLENPSLYMNKNGDENDSTQQQIIPNFQCILQSACFVLCEFSEDLNEQENLKMSLEKIGKSKLFENVLKEKSNWAFFDENLLLSLTQLVAKISIKEK